MIAANDNISVDDPIRFLSVCSGIEAASVAWHQLGWQCVGVAEIEPFPAFVLAHHYGAGRPKYMPDPMEPGIKPKDMRSRKTALKAMSRLPVDSPLPNYGDFTKIDPRTLGRVDILCGGTPCQAFSVAGLRQSLDDARGNLSLEFVRLAHELAAGNGLRNVIWENVVGVLSTKDNAFGCFLGGLVGAASAIERPARGKWGNSGLVSGPKGRAVWRIQDAQYHGLAQRRRRVLVVADFGNGADPSQVLFELDGVQRHSAPSRETGQSSSHAVTPSLVSSGRGVARTGDTRGQDPVVAVAYGGNHTSGPIDVSTALNSHGGPAGRLDFESETFIHQTVATLDASYGRLQGASGQDANHGHSHLLPIAYRVAGDGAAYDEGDCTAPLTTGTDPSANVIAFSAKDYGADASVELSPTLRAGGFTGSHANGGVMPAVAYGVTPFDTTQITSAANGSSPKAGDPCHPLSAGAHAPAIAFQSSQSGVRVGEVHATLDSNSGSRRHNGAIQGSAVRRLTPRECERLQGFQFLVTPDYPGAWQDDAGRWWSPDYTNIPWRGKPTSPDGTRYKALGNSWAVPKFMWLGRRIAMHMPARSSSTLQEAA